MDEKNTAPCQLISFVADNSASMSKEKLGELVVAFHAFAEEMKAFPIQKQVSWDKSSAESPSTGQGCCVIKQAGAAMTGGG